MNIQDFIDMIWDELEQYGRSYLFQPDLTSVNYYGTAFAFDTLKSMADDYGVVLVITKIRDERYEIYLRYMGGETE